MAPTVRIRVPETARPGEIVEIRTLISHPMETGFRIDENKEVVPVHIITDFACDFDGKEIFHARLQPAVSANPYLSFFARVDRSGTFAFTWVDDDGTVTRQEATITVTAA
jgi:sulfur-oxidizing protein SoxZ